VVSHRERRIAVHRRAEHGEWMTRVAIVGGRVAVASLDFDLIVDNIYRASKIS